MKMINVNLDGTGSKGMSRVASLIANGEDLSALRTNASLRKDEWVALDQAVISAAQKRLRVVADIRAAGLVYNLTDALGTMILEHETVSDMNDAEVSMTGKYRPNNDAVNFEISGTPIPIISKGFEINARKLRASRTRGQSLDTIQASLATFKVAEKIEQLTVTGSGGLTYGGYTIYGIENHPNANTGSLTASWTLDSARDPLNDVNAMIQALVDVHMYGPYNLIIPVAYQTAINEDYTSNYPKTLRSRILELEGIDGLRVSDHATATKVSMYQKSLETIRMIVGQDPMPVDWASGDEMTLYYKIMSIMIPQIRADQDGNCGVAVYSV